MLHNEYHFKSGDLQKSHLKVTSIKIQFFLNLQGENNKKNYPDLEQKRLRNTRLLNEIYKMLFLCS